MKTKGVTNLGKKLRKIRIDNDEISSDMARKLEISVSYLSAIENGKRNIPKNFAGYKHLFGRNENKTGFIEWKTERIEFIVC